MSALPMNKAERLALAAEVAPTVRATPEKTRHRVVTVYNQETGEIVGYTSGEEALKGLVKRIGVEFDVSGKRKERLICQSCGTLFRPNSNAKSTSSIRYCVECATPPCASCGVRLSRSGGTQLRQKRDSRRQVGICAKCRHERTVRGLCIRGHQLSTDRNGSRYCRTCCRIRNKKRCAARDACRCGRPKLTQSVQCRSCAKRAYYKRVSS